MDIGWFSLVYFDSMMDISSLIQSQMGENASNMSQETRSGTIRPRNRRDSPYARNLRDPEERSGVRCESSSFPLIAFPSFRMPVQHVFRRNSLSPPYRAIVVPTSSVSDWSVAGDVGTDRRSSPIVVQVLHPVVHTHRIEDEMQVLRVMLRA